MNCKRFFLFLFYFFLSHCFLVAQAVYDFGFERYNDVKVYENSSQLLFPWAGGMNSCHFSEIDLNLDGIMDLIIFDKHGNRIIPFINNGIPNVISYTYSPSYIQSLPALHDWVIFRDYDCDGKNDIFTYADGGGGIKVYRNISDTVLKFELAVDPYLTYSGNMPVNIWLTNADYPVIEDMDNDGDLDILTFGVLGKYLIYYKNMAMERHGNCSQFDFIKEDNCWGKFYESEASNTLRLNQTCSKNTDNDFSGGEIKHTGSTLLALDFNNDSIKDLIIGDVDYSNLIRLYNGGTKDSAYMVSQDTLFPSNTLPVHLFSFPCASLCDVNNDGKKDLLVSSYETRPNLAVNNASCQLYLDSGSLGHPEFKYSGEKRFFQDQMIDVGSGSYPVLFDYNHDSLADLFIGNWGYYDSSYYRSGYLYSKYHSQIALYKNTGTPSLPEFTLITRDFAGLSSLNISAAYPAFADLDGDGDADMLTGTAKGNILYFENTAGPGNPPQMVLLDTAYQGINPGSYCTPQLIDLDHDGLIDLVTGQQNGKISFYRNTGSLQNPQFTLVTDYLGEVNVTNTLTSFYGYSVPCFFKDSTGKYRLFVGTEQGNIFYYKKIENNLGGAFELTDTLTFKVNNHVVDLDEGNNAGIAVSDLNHDGYNDIIVGNFAGGLSYYKGIVPPPLNLGITNAHAKLTPGLTLYPNPANEYIKLEIEDNDNNPETYVEIFDAYGNTYYKNFLGIDNLISTKNLSSGIYFISVTSYKNVVMTSHRILKFIVGF